MGLAASQARFLAITARKADCEFRSMEIAQNKLSITRDMAEVSQKYMNAMNATKLVWDIDAFGMGTSEYATDLSYSVLTTPSVYNDYDPYIVTNRAGAVVLNGPLAAAAAKVSPNGSPCDRTTSNFKKFIAGLSASGEIDSVTNKSLQQLSNYKYNPEVGFGAEPIVKVTANTMDLLQLLNYKNTYEKSDGTKVTVDKSVGEVGYGSGSNADDTKFYMINGSANEPADHCNISLNDVLKNNCVLYWTADNLHTIDDLTKVTYDSKGNSHSHMSDEAVASVLYNLLTDASPSEYENDNNGTIKASVRKSGADYQSSLFAVLTHGDIVLEGLFNKAMKETLQLFSKASAERYNSTEWSESTVRQEAYELATEYNRAVFVENDKSNLTNSGYNSFYAVNLTNMVSCVLTKFEELVNGYSNGYYLGKTSGESQYVTDNPDYVYVTENPEAVSDTDELKLNFYMQLFNNICLNGWTKNEAVDDPSYFSQMLKNGTYYISSLATDGYYYQARYNNVGYMLEVEDEDAIARAEAEYNAAKSELTYKEEKLDLDMKNIDLEISALTTEYDTVKNLISTNVEKVFTMFQ